MADISAALVTYLKAYAGLTALVSTRIYPVQLPDDRTIPAVTYHMQTSPRTHVCSYAKPYFRITAWSYTHALSWQIAEQVRLALESYHGAMGTVHAFSMVEDLSDGHFEPVPDPGLFPVHVYARIWYQEAAG